MAVLQPKIEWGKQINALSTPSTSRNVRVERLETGIVRLHILQGLGPRASTSKSIAHVDLTEAQAQEISDAMEYAVHMDDGKVTPAEDRVPDPSLMKMTVPELKNIAKLQELDIKGMKKAAIALAIGDAEAPTPAKRPETGE